MAALHSHSVTQNHPQTFLDKKQPLMPRQSTSDVLSFTHIIANRLSPGQNVWDFFSPPETPQTVLSSQTNAESTRTTCASGLPPLFPTSSSPRPPTITGMITPTSPVESAFIQPNTSNDSWQRALAMDVSQAGEERVQDNNNTCQANTTSSPSTISPSSPIPLPQPAALMIPTATGAPTPTVATATLATATTTTTNIPKLQKRRSFAQSLKNSMISLTQLLSPTSSQSSRASSPTTSTSPPHYNILVLGSDSAPLASTIYKMSSLLPRSTKIRHYQEISGFFVAYFRSNDSFSCSPKIPTDGKPQGHQHNQAGKDIDDAKAMKEDTEALTITREDMDEVKSRRSSIRGLDDEEGVWAMSRSSEETLLQLKPSSMQSSMAESSYSNCNSDNSTVNSVKDMEREEVLLSDTEEPPEDANMDICEESGPVTSSETEENATVPSQQSTQPEQLNPSAKASLSVHAFSLDTTWPVPRILAQTFWFPFAHGIIYIVDATRKNDPRGVDHLLNARQFLASLVADPHFMRRDIPVVVFANKAGSDHETCYRLDEIAEILGCEDWDINVQGGNGSGGAEIIDGKTGKMRTRPWCVKSTRTDGAGDGIRASVEWLKSRMGEIWNP